MSTASHDTVIALRNQLASCLLEKHLRLATAESCTGGLIAKTCTDLPGSSAWFECAIVSYSNVSKQRLLGVSADVIAEHGAVSEQTVLAMLQGLFDRTDADLGVSVSGVAGPGGGTKEKPVGLVWLAYGHRRREHKASVYTFSGDRNDIREKTLSVAFKLLINNLNS